MLIEAIVFQDLIENIPQAVFGGILVKVGIDCFEWTPWIHYGSGLYWQLVGSRRSTQFLQNKYATAVAMMEEAAAEQCAIEGPDPAGGSISSTKSGSAKTVYSIPTAVLRDAVRSRRELQSREEPLLIGAAGLGASDTEERRADAEEYLATEGSRNQVRFSAVFRGAFAALLERFGADDGSGVRSWSCTRTCSLSPAWRWSRCRCVFKMMNFRI